MLTRVNSLLLVVFLFIPLMSLGDIGPLHRSLDWTPVTKVRITDNKYVYELSFAGARYNSETGSLPVFRERFSVGNPNINIEASITEEVWENISEAALKNIQGFEYIGSDLKISTAVAMERKQAFAAISFVPLRKNPASGSYQKLVSFSIHLRFSEQPYPQRAVAQVYKQNSVLASGNWYKVAVQFTGIHLITYDDLSS
ncbi:MAG: hypothetical protein IMY74_07885, partial [Bacteroidetes bacterium]|nr:hypothetical protein [Bacteroidota bacterium]